MLELLKGLYSPYWKTAPVRYKEHIRRIRTNKEDSEFVLHTLNNEHSYGTIQQTIAKIFMFCILLCDMYIEYLYIRRHNNF